MAFLNKTILASRQKAQLTLLYGRRRVGKTYLLHHWGRQTRTPFTYWTATREPAALQRRKIYAAFMNFPDPEQSPVFDSWSAVWQNMAMFLEREDQPRGLVFDELPYASEGDPAMLSTLQEAWDHRFQHLKLSLVLCGSHVRVMETLMSRSSPLFGRMTGQWHLEALPFVALKEFFPSWKPEERVAAYAIAGGIPAYLGWLNPARSLEQNLREVVFLPSSMFAAEPLFLLYDEVREPAVYLSILNAIARGHHALDDIASATLIGKTHLSSYLDKLQELRLVERRLPATLRPAERERSRRGRYHLRDAFMRFFFRFIAPHQAGPGYDPENAIRSAREGLRAFVGQTAFEDLAREWVRQMCLSEHLPLRAESIGSHWTRMAQTDVVAVDWTQRRVLIGECKWGGGQVGREVVNELLSSKKQAVLADLTNTPEQWLVIPMLFSRDGVTPAAKEMLAQHGGRSLTLKELDGGLGEV